MAIVLELTKGRGQTLSVNNGTTVDELVNCFSYPLTKAEFRGNLASLLWFIQAEAIPSAIDLAEAENKIDELSDQLLAIRDILD